ncbi:DNA-directed RNA polymerase subunit alpha like [Quillaja saponaria]|uniref:DNA-directed RNA polymerase subunit alpha like n=1 Tax=Quillaja saponaria TaxID=32244 RepID=A0AAD7PTA7_QUISA|nr:DNA-directed RNA polymerase subunit alpha like [Quillaja saponaria]
MKTNIIKDPNADFPLNSHSSPQQFPMSDIEMITIPAVSYTSLKDILPVTPISPSQHNSSWTEIPIKNPLLKQAVLSYLQPMSTTPEIGNIGLFGKLKDKCLCGSRGELGCLEWLSRVVLKTIRDVFVGVSERKGIENGEDEEEDED